MNVAELLTPEHILLPLPGRNLEEAAAALCMRLEEAGSLPPDRGTEVAQEILGERGELVRVNENVVLLAGRTDAVPSLTLALGVAPERIPVERGGEGGEARVVVVLLSPARIMALRAQAIPTLTRVLRDPDRTRRLLEARSPGDVLGLAELAEEELHEQPLVSDGLVPLQYRVYPDTPLDEVVGLMVRRGLRGVPVVGEGHDFLGMVTAAEVLRKILPGRTAGREHGREERPATARELMTRSVMCISEDQSLAEAVNLMASKGVDQLPVVREGELVGFLTVESALAALHGARSRDSTSSAGSGSGGSGNGGGGEGERPETQDESRE